MTTTLIRRSATAVARASAAAVLGVTLLIPLGSALGRWLAG